MKSFRGYKKLYLSDFKFSPPSGYWALLEKKAIFENNCLCVKAPLCADIQLISKGAMQCILPSLSVLLNLKEIEIGCKTGSLEALQILPSLSLSFNLNKREIGGKQGIMNGW